jgi:hypothetical protein
MLDVCRYGTGHKVNLNVRDLYRKMKCHEFNLMLNNNEVNLNISQMYRHRKWHKVNPIDRDVYGTGTCIVSLKVGDVYRYGKWQAVNPNFRDV